MAEYEETLQQDVLVSQSLQLFREQDKYVVCYCTFMILFRVWEFSSLDRQKFQPVIRATNSGTIVFDIAGSGYNFR